LAAIFSDGRVGLISRLPPQLGHLPFNLTVAHSVQKVHSNEQIIASNLSGASDRLQHSQNRLISSISQFLT
jgi:hypothetical protein